MLVIVALTGKTSSLIKFHYSTLSKLIHLDESGFCDSLRGSIEGHPACLRIDHLSYLPTLQNTLFCQETLFDFELLAPISGLTSSPLLQIFTSKFVDHIVRFL